MTKAEIASVVLSTVIIPLLVWLVSIAQKWVEENNKNKKLDKYIGIAFDSITKAVKAVGQTYIKKLKEQGEWTEDKEQEAFMLAKTEAIKIMGAGAYQALVALYGDIDALIRTAIEANIFDIKAAEKKKQEVVDNVVIKESNNIGFQ